MAMTRAHLKFEILDFAMLIPRVRQMRRFDASQRLVDVFRDCKLKKLLKVHIILRFQAFWMDIKIFGQN